MTKLFIDCEFNGFNGQLISMALVPEYPHIIEPFYEVIDHDWPNYIIDEWVKNNVIPFLNKVPISYNDFQTKLKHYLGNFVKVELIADWPDDIKYFCQSLITKPGEMFTTPIITMTYDRTTSASKSLIPHNALQDAIAIRESYLTK